MIETVYRYCPCDGLCGWYVAIDYTAAQKFMMPNGDIKPHDQLYCRSCQIWWMTHVEGDQDPQCQSCR